MSSITIVDQRVVKSVYDLDAIQAIVDHPTRGRLLLQQGFGGTDLEGGAIRWKHGVVAELHAGDTFEILDTPWNDQATVMDAVVKGYDNSRPVLIWPGNYIAALATNLGL